MQGPPVVYIVDDDRSQRSAADQLRREGLEAEWLHPMDVTEEHLERATLLAVDEYFDLLDQNVDEDYRVPADMPTALVPNDGLALAAVLRSASKRAGVQRKRPLGITLRTGDVDRLTAGLPQGIREPLVAQQYDLEWVTGKVGTSGQDPLEQVVALAHALHEYPNDWATSPLEVGLSWLGVPEGKWGDLARAQVVQCRPPTDTAESSAHGLSWLRWLAHRILPFPTFVISDVYVAKHFGVTVDSLRAVLSNADHTLAEVLRRARYTGPLAALYSDRFWLAGVEQVVSEVVDENDRDEPALVGQAFATGFAGLRPLDLDEPVVCIDVDYRPSDSVVERSSALRLSPDGWPAFADPAWAPATDRDEFAAMLAPRFG